ncbi:eukaryotic translation initiation factor 5 [Neodiprion pinetum]|uniref:Eukaryotic translation initiation factor 5 n=1 Tax=Neodiprion lecontei TaxID=441921 RepID=A0A6J0C9I7_NEOLC|nr:eukaryotic translation initiation factor 5 [Neodiprion fabricii]XP_046421078.1 eukaryotic translation initiation factor 5 [Neodiprion fabricii]XP_046421079.1 eukaryotic translation initiation factor 5 [Neodiprion fabricii]XP_046475703.1 eukaryotic translation initiation factor 5 [Neodiprion pinetum]XP_046475704.1 eukaryotic translation initiation factor 5 [Neodiprion pinetum]XP_046475705.1 eukaryotic translation initiation factor 5 [Neodiprion pinetum]XP_046594420.1 eukaryotic translation 
MGSLNVNRAVSDAFYRYKMPRIQAKVEGKGNGIKTVIVNMIEVAKAIGRPPTYPTKYFGCELGAQTQFDFKNERFIVNGSHDATKLQDLLDGFIRKYVLCPACDNPETELLISAKKGTISQGCKACGHHNLLEFNHKLNTFILKNPPSLNPAATGSSLTEGKRGKRSKKTNGDTNGDRSGSPENENSTTDIIVQAPTKIAVEDEYDQWAVDVSEEAVRARQQDLTDGAKGMTISDDLEKTEKERMDIFYELVKRRRDAGQLDSHKELVSEAERLEIKSKAPLVLAELLFDHAIAIQVKKHRVLLLRFTHDDAKAQKYLLGGIEQVIALHKDSLMPKVPGILKLFYDSDILEEKALLEWASKVSKKYVSKDLAQEIHDKAAPFLTWLKEAEEEDSDSQEEDDDLEIEYDDRAKQPLKQQQQQQQQPTKKPLIDDSEEDDVDIDAI